MTENLPESLRQFTDRPRPKELRLMAAQGLAPSTPKDLSLILYFLTLDEDKDVTGEEHKTLNGMPPAVVSTLLADAGTHPRLPDYFARTLEDENKLQRIALNNSTTADVTGAYFAEHTQSQSLIGLIANNHERVVHSVEIVESLSRNPDVTRSTLDGVLEFLKLYLGTKLGIPELSMKDIETVPDTNDTFGYASE